GDRGCEVRFALEQNPNEPRGNILLPTAGHALAFVEQLEWPDMVGLNPEFAHETMSGLSFHHGVAQTMWAGKLFHIDLNAQVIGKYDQDFRFGSEGIPDPLYLVKLLEDSQWPGMRHFDAHAYRTESAEGVWDFARGCMRTYLVLREKVARFHADREIQAALADAMVADIHTPALDGAPSPDAIAALRRGPHDRDAMAARGYGLERLDQLVTELILGAR